MRRTTGMVSARNVKDCFATLATTDGVHWADVLGLATGAALAAGELAGGEEADGLGVDLTLGGEDSLGQGFGGVAGEDGNSFFQEHRAVVVFLVGDVHGGAGFEVA